MAVLSVFPGAKVEQRRVDDYPIRVKIFKVEGGVEQEPPIWEGDQRGLFSKNGHRAVPEIKAALEAVKS